MKQEMDFFWTQNQSYFLCLHSKLTLLRVIWSQKSLLWYPLVKGGGSRQFPVVQCSLVVPFLGESLGPVGLKK